MSALTLNEVAERLGWSRRTLTRALKRHGIATIGTGRLELSPELVVMLAKTEKQPSGRVFPWGDRHNVYRWLRPLCKRLGVSYTPHQSRHAMATDLRALGYDMKAITERGLWRDERSASQPVANLPHLDNVLVGSLGDAWPYLARAAVEALKNPPDAALDAMNPSNRYASLVIPEAWNDAIDAILSEGDAAGDDTTQG